MRRAADAVARRPSLRSLALDAHARPRLPGSRIEEMLAKRAALAPGAIEASARQCARACAQLEAGRDLTRTWCVVDMDMFFAAVAMRENPSLRGKPVAVGGIGMISTANYVARRFGVRAAMPGFIALKLCPDLVFVGSDFALVRAWRASRTRDVAGAGRPGLIDQPPLPPPPLPTHLGLCGTRAGSTSASRSRRARYFAPTTRP